MKSYLDESLSERIAEIGPGMSLDIVTAHECGNDGSPDEIHLLNAAKVGRCLVTRGRDHSIALTVRFLQDDLPHASVLVVPYTLPTNRFGLVADAVAQYDRDHPVGISPYGYDYVRVPKA